MVVPTSICWYLRNGASGVGISLKAGQIDQLIRWFFMISMVARVAYTVIGLARMPPTVSTTNGIEATWSRCEWVMKMWSTCDSSASVRSPTPVPASIRMSESTRNEVVRRWRPPIPPEHPSTRSRMALLLVENPDAFPSRRRGLAPEFRHVRSVELVELAARVHALQIDQVHLDLIPVLRAERPQRLMPELELVLRLLVHLGLEPDGLEH